MSHAEALRRYGSDKPDLRNPLELIDMADLVRGCDFKVFAAPAGDPNGRVAALRVPGGGELTRKEIDDYTAYVARYGAKGLAYIKVNQRARGRDGLQSPIVKFLDDAAVEGILTRCGALDGDLIFFGADQARVVTDALGALRLRVGIDRKLVTAGWQPLWVVDFPMFEWDEDAKRWAAIHHPFTSPQNEDPAALRARPGQALARAYDVVLNGTEIGGGSVRIHREDMQSAVFDLLGISSADARLKFGFLLDALRFGCPPHGGIAFGLDRLAMLMAGADSIREVIAFPKTQTAADPLTDAPTEVSEAQLRELHIRLRTRHRRAEAPRMGQGADAVVYVHGLWMPGVEGVLLRRRLSAQRGFRCHGFRYGSVREPMAQLAVRLRQMVARIDAPRVHLLGHSLGGLVILRFLQGYAMAQPGRVLFLGTPAAGSRVARRVGALRLGRRLLGEAVSEELLSERPRRWDVGRELGIIAGTAPVGLGHLLLTFREDNDGVIGVSETELAGAKCRLCLPVNHSGMLLSARVAREAGSFLQYGRFGA